MMNKCLLVMVTICCVAVGVMSQGKLYAIHSESGARFAVLNTSTSSYVDVSNQNYGGALSSTGSIDATNRIYYSLLINDTTFINTIHLIGISLDKGNLLINLELDFIFPFDNYTFCSTFIPSTGEVLILSWANPSIGFTGYSIFTVNTTTGEYVTVAYLGNIESLYCGAYDQKNNIYWLQMSYHGEPTMIYGYNIQQRALVHNVAITYHPQNMQYDQSTGTLIGLTDHPASLVIFDPASLKQTALGGYSNVYSVLNGAEAAIDPYNRHYFTWMQYSSEVILAVYDIDNGESLGGLNGISNPYSLVFDTTKTA